MTSDQHTAPTQPLIARKSAPLAGSIAPPGDKSISHRALIFGGLAVGETVITGLLESEDVMATAAAMRAFGADIEKTGDGRWRVQGVGVGGLAEPAGVLDMGNSGTAARLLIGLASAQAMTSFFTGDASLVRRPMQRIIAPLTEMGASFVSRSGGRLPLAVTGGRVRVPITYRSPVASAQVKSAILLAGLNTSGRTTVIEPAPSRDHSERMLRAFGAVVETAESDQGHAVSIAGYPDLRGQAVTVPADPSSAAFPLVAALLVPGSTLTITDVSLNPGRTGLFDTLAEMGADLAITACEIGGEPIGTLSIARHRPLRGVDVPAERVPAMIDEFPILAIAAACAEGPTRMTGIGELRVKESDRLAMIEAGLQACGVKTESGPDWLTVHGTGRAPAGGARIATALDHRIAMSFLVLGLVSDQPVEIDDARPIATSFPGFVGMMNGLGALIEVAG